MAWSRGISKSGHRLMEIEAVGRRLAKYYDNGQRRSQDFLPRFFLQRSKDHTATATAIGLQPP